ncbi:MAG: hypothetical protein SOW32_04660, partial [Agathobacter sp.]|nr:hypothetical protein [Agathobacter sp.]
MAIFEKSFIDSSKIAIYEKSAKQISCYHAFPSLISPYQVFNPLFPHIAKFMNSNTMTKANFL